MNIRDLQFVLLEADINLLNRSLKDYNISEEDKFGNNILHDFIKHTKDYKLNPIDAIDLFVNAGIDINKKQSVGNFKYSPLHLSVINNQKDIFNYLIKKDADVNAQDANGNTILSSAVFNYGKDTENYAHYIETLLAKGAKTNVSNNFGVTAFSLAHSISNFDVKKFFP